MSSTPERGEALTPLNFSAVCPKCHNEDISMHYQPASTSYLWNHEPREHILRRCTRCRYHWAEAPLDTERSTT